MDQLEELAKLYHTPGAPRSSKGLKELLNRRGVKLPLKTIDTWLKDQSVGEIHRKKKLLNLNIQTVYAPFDVWESDLLDLGQSVSSRVNGNYKHILVCVDKFSKMVFCEPVKTLTKAEVTAAMKKVLSRCVKKYDRRPNHLVTDAGGGYVSGEFKELMKKFAIQHRISYMAFEAERSIRHLKELLQRTFTHRKNTKWIDILSDMVELVNDRKHRGTKMTPNEAIQDPHTALENLKGYWKSVKAKEPEVFSVGDKVRLRVKKGTFAKGHVEEFSSRVYRVQRVFPPQDEFKSHRYALEGSENMVYTYNDLLKTNSKVTEEPIVVVKKKDRLQKQAEKELRELDTSAIRRRRTRDPGFVIDVPATNFSVRSKNEPKTKVVIKNL